MPNANSAEYEALIDRLMPHEPHFGWGSAKDIPELTDADLGAVLATEPDLLSDAMGMPEVAQLAARYLTRTDESAFERSARLGIVLKVALEAEVRRYLLRQLRIESERREIARETAIRDAKCGFLSAQEV